MEAAKNKIKEAGINGPSQTVLEIKGLKKSFGNNDVLKDINLEIKQGENLGVMGKSGTGKSVLIKCIVRLIEPDAGKIILNGQNILDLKDKELNELRKKIGFVFQSSALYDSMTVRQNLEFPLRTRPEITSEETEHLVKEALENVGLLEAIDKMPIELSGGMRKRVGLARTLIIKPEIILYDEPTTGLDPITAREISELILNIQEKYKATSIVITHDLECARLVTNRLILINDGVIVAEGTFNELAHSKDKWVQSFLGNQKTEGYEKAMGK